MTFIKKHLVAIAIMFTSMAGLFQPAHAEKAVDSAKVEARA